MKMTTTIVKTVAAATLLTSCTISMQNVSTHGTATDLIDQDQSPTNDVKPNIDLPITPA